MRLFISWSGALSEQVADLFRGWIPLIVHSAKPFMSAADTEKGSRWTEAIAQELEQSYYGLICVTPDNMLNPWLNFEAGALSRSLDRARVSPFCFEVKKADLRGPLSLFQATASSRPDVFRLVKSMNSASAEPRDNETLLTLFDKLWPSLEADLKSISDNLPDGQNTDRKAEDMLAELIQLAHAHQRALSKIANESPKLVATKEGRVDFLAISHLLARTRITTNVIAQSPDFNNPKIVELRGLISMLIKSLLPVLGTQHYESFLRLDDYGNDSASQG